MRNKSAQTILFQKIIIVLLIVLGAANIANLFSQDLQGIGYVVTSRGAIVAEQCAPDVLTISFEGETNHYIDVPCHNLDYAGDDTQARLEALLLMTDDAAVVFRVFLIENSLPDIPSIEQYYEKCSAIRNRVMIAIPEIVLVEAAFRLKAQS